MSASRAGDCVVIIGAGIIGLACAHYLAADGRQVTVLEKGTIAGACSHGNCGLILPSHILPVNAPGAVKTALTSLFDRHATFRVKPQIRLSFVNWMLQFALASTKAKMLDSARHLKTIVDSSLREFETLLEAGGIECDWRKAGLLHLFRSRKEFDQYAETDDLLSEHFGVSARRIEGEALPGIDPALKPGLAGGYFYEDDARLRPDLLASAWASRLRAKGVQFVEHCEAHSVERSGPRVTAVASANGRFEAGSIVLAAGACSGAFARELGCSVPVEPGKGYSITLESPPRRPKSSLVLPEHHVAITPFSDGLRIGSMMEFVGFDDSISARRVRQLRASAAPFIRDVAPDAPATPWCGWRPMTWDSLPIIGCLPGWTNAVVATGHCMMGVMLAPATGRLVAEILGERQTHIPHTPFSPDRFIHAAA